MPGITWRHRARNDLKRLYEFLNGKDEAAAALASRAILDGVRQLRAMPRMGRPMDDGTGRRELVVPFSAAGYVVCYIVDDGEVVIIRVWLTRESAH
jgi:plasmid stabilization system protein ParE